MYIPHIALQIYIRINCIDWHLLIHGFPEIHVLRTNVLKEGALKGLKSPTTGLFLEQLGETSRYSLNCICTTIWFQTWNLPRWIYCEETSNCSIDCNINSSPPSAAYTVYPKKYAHGFCFAVLCCGYTLTDFPISIRLASLALWQSNDCPSASKATPMNMDKYFVWIHYKRLHNHNKAKHNKTVCIFLGIYCMRRWSGSVLVQITACRLHGAKPLSKPMLGYSQLVQTVRNKLQWNLTKYKPRRPFCLTTTVSCW